MKHVLAVRCVALLSLLTLVTTGDSVLSADETNSTLIQPTAASGRTIFSANFEHAETGLYTDEHLNLDWNRPTWSDGVEERRVWVVKPDSGSKALTVNFPARTYGPEKNGAVWRLEFDAPYKAVEVRFDVMFKKNLTLSEEANCLGYLGAKAIQAGTSQMAMTAFQHG